jgi:hypothetical protein
LAAAFFIAMSYLSRFWRGGWSNADAVTGFHRTFRPDIE